MSPPVSRGFRHFRRPTADEQDRVPPGQYVTQGFPVLSAGPTPHTPLPDWSFSIRRAGETLKSWTWRRVPGAAAQDGHRRHPLRDAVVRSWTPCGAACRWTRCSDQVEHDAPYVMAFSDGGYTTNLPVQDVTSGQAWLAFGYDGQPLAARARRPGPPAGTASVLLEECEVGARPGTARPRPARLLGELRLPHLRRPMAGTAVRGRLTWQIATVSFGHRRNGRGPHDRAGRAGLAGAPGRAASRRQADRRGRLQRGAVVLHRLGRDEPVAITVERLDDGEVSPYLTEELRAGDQLEVRGPIGGYFVWDTGDGGPLLLVAGGSGVVPLRAILRHRQRTGSDVPARLLYSSRTLADVIYHERARPVPGRHRGQLHADPEPAAGLDRLLGPCRTPRCLPRSPGRPVSIRSHSSAGPPASSRQLPEAWSRCGYPAGRVKTERFGGT